MPLSQVAIISVLSCWSKAIMEIMIGLKFLRRGEGTVESGFSDH